MRQLLGADVFVVQLLVWLVISGILFTNSNNSGKNPDEDEEDLPKIELPKGNSEGIPGGQPGNTVTLSAKKKGGAIEYFIDNRPVKYHDLPIMLKARRISSVRIRFDKRISYGRYVRILNLCKQSGVAEIINVYKIEK